MKAAGIVLTAIGAFNVLIGFIWVVIYYASSAELPIRAIENWNILIGAGFGFFGLVMLVIGIILMTSAPKKPLTPRF